MAFRKILLPFGFDRNLIERLKFKIVEVSGKNTSSEQGRQNDFLHQKVPKFRKYSASPDLWTPDLWTDSGVMRNPQIGG